jgi:hypothetical protein
MPCEITSNFIASCADLRANGGLNKRIWRAVKLAGFAYTKDVDGYVDGFTMDGTAADVFVELTGPRNAHSAGFNIESTDGGGISIMHNVSVRALVRDADQRDTIEEWVSGDGPIVALDNNGQFKMYGELTGMNITEGSQDSGQDMSASEVALTMTLQGTGEGTPLFVLDTNTATTLALLETLTVGYTP